MVCWVGGSLPKTQLRPIYAVVVSVLIGLTLPKGCGPLKRWWGDREHHLGVGLGRWRNMCISIVTKSHRWGEPMERGVGYNVEKEDGPQCTIL